MLSVDYRLAPETVARKRPGTASTRCAGSGHVGPLGGDAERLAVAGDSAGGNLAAVVALVLRDGAARRLAHQALIYPGADATMAAVGRRSGRRADADAAKIVAFLDRYLPAGLEPGPAACRRCGPTLGLPPALVQTADLDPLRDEGALYATRLSDAGVPVRLTNYLGAPHGFASFPGATPIAAQARAELVGELRSHLALRPHRSGRGPVVTVQTWLLTSSWRSTTPTTTPAR